MLGPASISRCVAVTSGHTGSAKVVQTLYVNSKCACTFAGHDICIALAPSTKLLGGMRQSPFSRPELCQAATLASVHEGIQNINLHNLHIVEVHHAAAGLPQLPIKASAATLKMDVKALQTWAERNKPVCTAVRTMYLPASTPVHCLSHNSAQCAGLVQLHQHSAASDSLQVPVHISVYQMNQAQTFTAILQRIHQTSWTSVLHTAAVVLSGSRYAGCPTEQQGHCSHSSRRCQSSFSSQAVE